MTSNVEMTRDGGFYYRAVIYHWIFVSVVIVPFGLLVLLALVNPFWFRSNLFNTIERWATQMARYRDRIKYKLYLGTDPAMWHALKDK